MSVEALQIKRFNSMERRPRTLKDFLSENHSSSCSSSGFKSLPRMNPNTSTHKKSSTMNTLIEMELKKSRNNKNTPQNSTFQTLINTIRTILVKKSATMILPRSISRKLSSSSTPSKSRRMRNQSFCKGGSEVEVSTIKIKDIIRWKSFRDINNVEEIQNQSQPLDFTPQSSSPPLDFHHYMIGSTTTTTTTTTCSSNGSSWNESDFTSSSWNNIVEESDKFSFSPIIIANKNSVEPTTKMAVIKGVSTFKEDEQHSPVSVLQIGQDEFSPFDQNLSNFERSKQKSIQSIQRLEGVPKFDKCLLLDNDENSNNYDEEEIEEQDYGEERARELLQCVKSTGSIKSCKDYYLDILLLDFFREELIGIRDQNNGNCDEDCEREILKIAKDWINGSSDGCDMEHVMNKDACIKDMKRKGNWEKFENEKQELALEIEIEILHSLVDEVLNVDD